PPPRSRRTSRVRAAARLSGGCPRALVVPGWTAASAQRTPTAGRSTVDVQHALRDNASERTRDDKTRDARCNATASGAFEARVHRPAAVGPFAQWFARRDVRVISEDQTVSALEGFEGTEFTKWEARLTVTATHGGP